MPRTSRNTVGGVVYHALNRGNGRRRIFKKPWDYKAFLDLLLEAKKHAKIDVLGFCLMPNHWHLVVRPEGDGDLPAYMSWLTNTHVKRYRAHYPQTSGHLYQGRYKSFPVEEDLHYLMLLRYVEANALRAKLVQRAEDWQWSSLGAEPGILAQLLTAWPVERPRNWKALVNEPPTAELESQLAPSFDRDRPLGSKSWVAEMAKKMGVQHSLNPRGRPKKAK